jgi:hypothetical protein
VIILLTNKQKKKFLERLNEHLVTVRKSYPRAITIDEEQELHTASINTRYAIAGLAAGDYKAVHEAGESCDDSELTSIINDIVYTEFENITRRSVEGSS